MVSGRIWRPWLLALFFFEHCVCAKLRKCGQCGQLFLGILWCLVVAKCKIFNVAHKWCTYLDRYFVICVRLARVIKGP